MESNNDEQFNEDDVSLIEDNADVSSDFEEDFEMSSGEDFIHSLLEQPIKSFFPEQQQDSPETSKILDKSPTSQSDIKKKPRGRPMKESFTNKTNDTLQCDKKSICPMKRQADQMGKQSHPGKVIKLNSSHRTADNTAEGLSTESSVNTKKPAGSAKLQKKYFLINYGEPEPCLLPEGWARVLHDSGLPVFLHLETRVVTTANPYHIGSEKVRLHEIPLHAIPCLAYRRAKEDDKTKLISKEEGISLDNAVAATDNQAAPDSATPATTTQSDAPVNEGTSDSGPETTAPLSLEPEPPEPDDKPPSPPPQQDTESDREEGELSSDNEDKPPPPSAAVPEPPSPPPTTDNHPATPPATPAVVVKEAGLLLPSNQQIPGAPAISGGDQQQLEVQTRVLTVGEKTREEMLTTDQVHDYMTALFEFDEKEVMVFSQRKDRHTYLKQQRVKSRTNRRHNNPIMMMAANENLIKFKIPNNLSATDRESGPNRRPRMGIINPAGKSYVSILHEYCQHVLRTAAIYNFTVLNNERTPYSVTVMFGKTPYATGYGLSKKAAKMDAAKRTLEMLIPDFSKIVENTSSNTDGPSTASTPTTLNNPASSSSCKPCPTEPSTADREFEMFDTVGILDRRVSEMSLRMTMPPPCALLHECLKRNCMSERQAKVTMSARNNNTNNFTITIGEHIVTVPCRNKREGRHKAAQAMLAKLHPEITSWGGILRLYGPGSRPDMKSELDMIQQLQNKEKGSVKTGLLSVLKIKMRELAEQWEKEGATNKAKFNAPHDRMPHIYFHEDAETDIYQ